MSATNDGVPAAVPSMAKWQHTTDPLHIRRLGKTGEELAELLAVVSRCLIQGLDEIDPSSGKTNRQRFIDETADVRAQLNCNDRAFGLPIDEIERRIAKKETWMAEWESHYGPTLAQLPEAAAARQSPDSGEVSRPAEERSDDVLTVAHVTTEGGGILTMLAASLGDLIDIVGDEPETYTVSIATMKRADFEALGEFDGF